MILKDEKSPMPNSNKKITTVNRKFFLKWLPFNFCDRFCERCEEFQDDCKVYQDEIEFKTSRALVILKFLRTLE